MRDDDDEDEEDGESISWIDSLLFKIEYDDELFDEAEDDVVDDEQEERDEGEIDCEFDCWVADETATADEEEDDEEDIWLVFSLVFVVLSIIIVATWFVFSILGAVSSTSVDSLLFSSLFSLSFWLDVVLVLVELILSDEVSFDVMLSRSVSSLRFDATDVDSGNEDELTGCKSAVLFVCGNGGYWL